RDEVRPQRCGSPAHAGIDPLTPGVEKIRARLPRTRGDRPRITRDSCTSTWAPPHTRGSTWSEEDGPLDAPGSPAHAGIDPEPQGLSASSPRLPRTRGDRPLSFSVSR